MHRLHAERGVALAVVVWFIAGMSVLVAGIVAQARVDTQLAQIHLFRAQAEAAGDGAIRLLLADLLGADAAQGFEQSLPGGEYRLGEFRVQVLAVPVAVLVDVNAAPLPVLASVLLQGGVEAAEADRLAASMVEWRSSRQRSRSGPVRFEVIEDMLRVEGMTRARLDAIRHLVTANATGRGLANLPPSREDHLAALSALAPQAWAGAAAPTAPDIAAMAAGSAGSYRVDAIVSLGGRQWLRRRWIAMRPASGSRLPWASERAEVVRVVGASA